MNVLKFGGSSVGTVASLLNVKKIVEAHSEPVIVVVSALGGVTDMLIQMGTMAADGDEGYLQRFDELVMRHEEVMSGLFEGTALDTLRNQIRGMLDELANIYKGIYLIRDLSEKTQATVVSYGERLSSLIVSRLIKNASHCDSRHLIKTEKQFHKHIVDFSLTN